MQVGHGAFISGYGEMVYHSPFGAVRLGFDSLYPDHVLFAFKALLAMQDSRKVQSLVQLRVEAFIA